MFGNMPNWGTMNKDLSALAKQLYDESCNVNWEAQYRRKENIDNSDIVDKYNNLVLA